ncbi:hypothetical protein HAX54_033309 [Datura stramonium]|uniref:NB-ARC domain-containing protein n=1 Tax=Datura stramonium TaxID=4076 RepID=A0ABS8SD55_DATST|nr:hypothetical protein [Datura stramonium]
MSENAKLDKEAENALAEMLRKKLSHARYLIFIDDIWHTSAWDDLYLCFPDNNNGSRIILTTHHCIASYATLVSDPLDLQFLSNDESWMLLKKKWQGILTRMDKKDIVGSSGNKYRKKAKQENFLESVKRDKGFDPSHVFPPKYRTPRRLSLHSQLIILRNGVFLSHMKSFQFREDRNILVSLIDHASFLFKRFQFLRVLDLEFTIIGHTTEVNTFEFKDLEVSISTGYHLGDGEVATSTYI